MTRKKPQPPKQPVEPRIVPVLLLPAAPPNREDLIAALADLVLMPLSRPRRQGRYLTLRW